MKIYLIGYMGCGKSTIGLSLANELGISFFDLDAEFELKYKITISEFFSKYGESTFRELEHKLLTDLSNQSDVVVSTGGGTPCHHNNMELMNKTGITVYLSASPALIYKRVNQTGSKRPLFQQMNDANVLENIAIHMKSRETYYNQAHIIMDATCPDLLEMKKQIQETFDIKNA